MKIFLVDNDDSFAGEADVENGATAGEAVQQRKGKHVELGDYCIRVNRKTYTKDQLMVMVLSENDRVTITPHKIEVAA
jgi:hypothetical protein